MGFSVRKSTIERHKELHWKVQVEDQFRRPEDVTAQKPSSETNTCSVFHYEAMAELPVVLDKK